MFMQAVVVESQAHQPTNQPTSQPASQPSNPSQEAGYGLPELLSLGHQPRVLRAVGVSAAALVHHVPLKGGARVRAGQSQRGQERWVEWLVNPLWLCLW